jgi:ArsR family transcriptional regulator
MEQLNPNPIDAERAALMFAAIGHPVRLRVFRELVQVGPQGLAAGEIARMLNMPCSSLSFHLRALQNSDLLVARQQGRFVFYAARFDSVASLLAYLTDNCCGGNPCMPVTSDKTRLVAPCE